MVLGVSARQGCRGTDIIELIDTQGKRLDKPRDCPGSLYAVMQHCWERL